jgi:REP-associated tyrosine transposase
MPRTGRVVLPDYPHHVVQRGHNRQVVFAEPADYRYYLDTLTEFKAAFGVRVYAFCLMTNHVHLLLAPDTRAGMGQLMKRLAGRQTRYHNRAEGRRGTLWESRYKSSPVQTDGYLLACIRYIELNPVRARMVAAPEQYPWCSFHRWEEYNHYPWLDPLPFAIAGGEDEERPAKRYRDYIGDAIPGGEWELIREAVQRGQLTGNARFVNEVEQIIGKRIEHRRSGRPKREK